MTRPAITVDGISKAYRIGLREQIEDTLVGEIKSWLRSPLKNLQYLRELNTFGLNGDDQPGIVWALRNISFEVAEGEVVGFIGRNGAGKSTLLKILSRITEPTQGRAVIRGRVASLLEVGTGFHQDLSGRENIYMNGTILGMRKTEIDRKFDQIVEFSGVEKFLDTPVKRYSSGMRVRLAFSVAAHLEPEILVIDEVLAVGDAEFQRKCLGKMHDVARSGRTVLFVSHNMSAVAALTTRCVFLKYGRIARISDTESCIEAYYADCLQEAASQAAGLDYFRRDRHDGSPVRIKAISATGTGLNGAGLAMFDARTPISLTLKVQADEFVSRAYIKVTVTRHPDTVVSTIFSGDQGMSFGLSPGTNEIRCVIEGVTFAPGTYSVTVGVTLNPRAWALDLIVDLPLFEVSLNDALSPIIEWPDRNWGTVRLTDEVTWHHSPKAETRK